MKYLFTVALIALAIQLVASTGTSTTSTESTTTTTTTTTDSSDTTTTTTDSSDSDTTTTERKHRKKLCWRGNDWCGTFVPKRRKCKNGKKNCRRVVVRVTRRKTA
ncbi:uncharacterized protein [Drosophila bipectinata]|uniref:uncharacterized protein n=1 Tax=Drosophila bipectinata TaxID=42026 RepID=UPI001C89A8D5|nr:integumentary mucin C.1-like [Drosophila bipectinata]